MKIVKVIPIFKAGDNTLMKNYRPVSLLPAFSKLLERIMYNKLMGFLNSNNILYQLIFYPDIEGGSKRTYRGRKTLWQ